MDARLVALQLAPGRAFSEALDRSWASGDAVVPLDPLAPEPVTRALLRAVRPSALVDEHGEHHLAGGVPVRSGTALVVPTSSEQKAAVLRHAALQAATAASLARLAARESDRWLCCLPTHHIAGLLVLLRARALGSEAIIHPRFDPTAVDAERDVSHIALVPTMLARLLDAGADVARYRAILLGGAAAPPYLLDRARAAGARLVTTYGMTESCGGCVYDGVPLDGYEVGVGDDGRIRIRGPVCDGYRLREDLTRAAFEGGWLVTSDRGEWDGERLIVHGRADDVIVSGGENIDGSAVARVLSEHPSVADAAVVGEPDPDWGEIVVAYCVGLGGATPSEGELVAHVRESLGRLAAPKMVHWVATLPRGPLGKVRHDRLMRDDGGESHVEESQQDG